jgi:DNA-nicking Smr family endonuclease
MASPNGKRRLLSYDERVLWTMVTQSIDPLHDALREIEKTPPAEPAKPARTKPVSIAAPPPPPPPAAATRPPPLTPLGRRARQRVARGRDAIDARFDLHGLTQAEAHSALARFLRSASARGARLVLIITGKGRAGDNERGVLRRQVPHWLALPELRELVIGFEEAHGAHGGEGALYVRLRRQRAAGEDE